MLKISHVVIVIITVLIFGCSGEKPDASFTVSNFNVSAGQNVTFSNTSVNADYYEWYFGDGETSENISPDHKYTKAGTYYVTLIAYNSFGMTQAWSFVFVTDKYIVTFNNTVYTDIEITLGGETKTCPVDGSVTFEYDENPGSYSYYATTFGATSTGSVLGEILEWDVTHYDIGETSDERDLDYSEDYFFLYMQNFGTIDLGPVRVNAGFFDEIEEDVVIPGDGVQYSIGYYYAYNGTRIEADLGNTGEYVFWENGSQFDFPWVHNQYLLAHYTPGISVQSTRIPSDVTVQKQMILQKLLKNDRIIGLISKNTGAAVDYGIAKH